MTALPALCYVQGQHCLKVGPWQPVDNPKRPASKIYVCPPCLAEQAAMEAVNAVPVPTPVPTPDPQEPPAPRKLTKELPLTVGVGVEKETRWKP